MSLPVDGVGAWRANVERAAPIRAFDPVGSGAALSPWQALMATASLERASGRALDPARGPAPDVGDAAPDWRARVEPGPARPATPTVVDDPARIETASAAPTNPGSPGLFQDGDFSFADLIDAINPLQHIPIVSSIYRELTGDRIGYGARFAGDLLFLGPVGGLTALANVVLIESSGKDAGEHVLALLKNDQAPVLAANSAPAGDTKAKSNAAPNAEEQALAELLPPGAIPIAGSNVEFARAALRPERSASFTARPAAPAPEPAQPLPVADDDLPPAPPPGPIAGPGWKGFYSPPESKPEVAKEDASGRPPVGGTQRALAPDPLAALVARRTPGSLAGAMGAPAAGAIGTEGGWFSDVMLDALAKYETARQLRGPQAPEAARAGAVNVVN